MSSMNFSGSGDCWPGPVQYGVHDSPPEQPPAHLRRRRYAGKNPREYHEKYKELNPAQYPGEVEKVLAAGKTPAGMHASPHHGGRSAGMPPPGRGRGGPGLHFAGLPAVLAEEQLAAVDLILADLGVSSMQFDNPDRGFSYKGVGPLDMRMNPSRGESAAQLIARASEEDLAGLLDENADEPHARLIARLLKQQP